MHSHEYPMARPHRRRTRRAETDSYPPSNFARLHRCVPKYSGHSSSRASWHVFGQSRHSHVDAGMPAHCSTAVVRQRQLRTPTVDINECVLPTRWSHLYVTRDRPVLTRYLTSQLALSSVSPTGDSRFASRMFNARPPRRRFASQHEPTPCFSAITRQQSLRNRHRLAAGRQKASDPYLVEVAGRPLPLSFLRLATDATARQPRRTPPSHHPCA